METFLGTLVQTTATLIALLLAAIAAYFVFLQGKSAEYDDRIEAERGAIRTEISSLQARWPATVSMYLPPEFRERFSAQTGNSHGVQLIEKFATGITFPSPALQAALSDVAKNDTFGQEYWKGRVYAVALTEAVNVISAGAQLEQRAFTLGKPEPRPERSTAFPRSASGAGFEEWRKDFDRVGTALRFLEPEAPTAISDFQSFLQSKPQLRSSPLASLYINGVRAIFNSVNAIRVHLRIIDDLSLSKSRYSFSGRVHGKSLLILIAAAALVGIVVPLFSLTGSVARLSALAMNAILLASLVLTAAGFVQLGLDVFKPLHPDPKLYVSDRWLRPIMEDLERNSPQLESGSPIQFERLIEFLGSDGANQVPSELRDELNKYRSYAEAYNSSAEQLDAIALTHLERDLDFAPFRRPYLDSAHIQHPILYPSDLAGPSRVEQLRHDLASTREIVLGVETQYSWGSRGRLSFIAAPQNRDSLIVALENLSGRLAPSAEARDFKQKRANLLVLLPAIKERVSGWMTR